MVPNFSFLLPDQLAASAHPGYGADLRNNLAWLYKQGIRAVLTLTSESLPDAMLSECGLYSLHLPVVDFTAPAMEQIESGVEYIQRIIEKRQAVLIHCGSGYGRTGTMAACYLVKTGKTAEEAITYVRLLRPGSIETQEQEEAVREFAQNA